MGLALTLVGFATPPPTAALPGTALFGPSSNTTRQAPESSGDLYVDGEIFGHHRRGAVGGDGVSLEQRRPSRKSGRPVIGESLSLATLSLARHEGAP